MDFRLPPLKGNIDIGTQMFGTLWVSMGNWKGKWSEPLPECWFSASPAQNISLGQQLPNRSRHLLDAWMTFSASWQVPFPRALVAKVLRSFLCSLMSSKWQNGGLITFCLMSWTLEVMLGTSSSMATDEMHCFQELQIDNVHVEWHVPSLGLGLSKQFFNSSACIAVKKQAAMGFSD